MVERKPLTLRNKEKKVEKGKGKKIKSSEFIMKSFVRVCVHRKSSEWKESSESRRSRIVVYSPWNLEFEVNQDEYLNGHERQ